MAIIIDKASFTNSLSRKNARSAVGLRAASSFPFFRRGPAAHRFRHQLIQVSSEASPSIFISSTFRNQLGLVIDRRIGKGFRRHSYLAFLARQLTRATHRLRLACRWQRTIFVESIQNNHSYCLSTALSFDNKTWLMPMAGHNPPPNGYERLKPFIERGGLPLEF